MMKPGLVFACRRAEALAPAPAADGLGISRGGPADEEHFGDQSEYRWKARYSPWFRAASRESQAPVRTRLVRSRAPTATTPSVRPDAGTEPPCPADRRERRVGRDARCARRSGPDTGSRSCGPVGRAARAAVFSTIHRMSPSG